VIPLAHHLGEDQLAIAAASGGVAALSAAWFTFRERFDRFARFVRRRR
jgi:hypothetical protein